MPAPLRDSLPVRFGIGAWQVDTALDELSGPGGTHKIEPRAMRLLVVLAQAGGEVVSASALLDAVWPGLVVTPSSLYDAVAQLRRVLGPGLLLNVARKGYRLATPVRREGALPAPAVKAGLGPRSIAVLPFRALALAEAYAFLRESLTDGLISELSRQSGLTVVARGTMLTFGDSTAAPRDVAAQLGARFVVDGRLEGRGDQLMVSVQVADGWHDTQTWADELQLPLASWPEMAGVVVGRLARALHFELNDLATRTAVPEGDAALQARALAAQSWVQLFARPQTRETNEAATRLAQQALALAPQLAQATTCMAFCDWRAAQYHWSAELPSRQMARALAGAQRAVELDPRDPDGHYVLGLITFTHGQLPRAEEALHQCLRLSSSYAPAHGLLGMLRDRRGFPAETAAHCRRAFELSPREPLRAVWYGATSMAALTLGDAATASEEAQRGMAVNPDFPLLYVAGAAAAHVLGAHAQAAEWVGVLQQRTAFVSVAATRQRMAPSYAPSCRAHLERVLAALRAAGLPEG